MVTSVRPRRRARAALAGALVLGLLAAAHASAGGSGPSTWQGGPLHDGHARGAALAPPLAAAWRVELPRVGHAVVGDGRVFVVSARPEEDGQQPYGNLLHALDREDGRRLWTQELGGTYYLAGHAYDDGRVFSVNGDGLVRAHDAATGEPVWERTLDQYAFSSPPVAVDGTLYVEGAGSGGTLYALDAATGADRWRQPVSNGGHSSPVVSADHVYVAYACGRTHAFDRATGRPVWDRTTSCGGGGGATAVLHQDRLYVRDSQFGAVLDASTGSELSVFPFTVAPAFHSGTAYLVADGRLVARDAVTGQERWASGEGDLLTPPALGAGHVYVGGQDRLYAYRQTDGQLVWQGDTPVDGVDEHNVSEPYDGITIDGDRLFVSGGDTLTAYSGVPVEPEPVPSATVRPTPTGSATPAPTATPGPTASPTTSGTPTPAPGPLPSCLAVPGVVSACVSLPTPPP